MRNKNINNDNEIKQLKDLRDRIILNDFQVHNEQYLEQLILTLQETQENWQEVISELKQYQTEYKNLITQINKIKKLIIDDGLKSKISIFTKLKIRILSVKKY
ncbi:MAG: hypothetical protein IJV31_00815 [Clostridia bacterium]|nr:hypothetical protein [Clostridia bacterium]MBQ9657292.1 hypothetical protein [Clostridia bacterium]